jgi:hypothetical protein
VEGYQPDVGGEQLQRIKDAEHLRILVVCHYVYAGMVALFSLFPIIHVVFGLVMTFSPSFGAHSSSGGPPPPQWMGLFFAGFGLAIIVVGETFAVLTFLAGRSLAARRRRVFALIMAGINCLYVPIGTALGVFTILVLSRPSVQRLFESEDAAPPEEVAPRFR